MTLKQNSSFIADDVTALINSYAESERLKEQLFIKVLKLKTSQKNTLDTNSAKEWIPFLQENEKSVPSDFGLSDFIYKSDAEAVLAKIEKLENKAQGTSKALRDVISSDLRAYWFESQAIFTRISKDPMIKEKYKNLPSLSPKRTSDTKVEKAFKKLEAKRRKKNGSDTTLKA